MTRKLLMLDRVLEMSRDEMRLIEEGDYEGAEKSSIERGEILRQALEMEDGERGETLMAKLTQLRSFQSQLSSEARRLHESLRENLTRTQAETRRYGAYHQAAKPRLPFANGSVYVSKRG